MSADSDALDRLIATIVSVRKKFDPQVFHVAIAAARIAVAGVVLEEAERRAGVRQAREPCVVVRFPNGRRARTRHRPDR